jgi:hypothetical protein
MMLAIGPRCRFPPEMIMMATLRLSSTPYGAYPNTERVIEPGAEVPPIGTDSPAAGTIGKRGRVTVAHFWFRTESERRWSRRGGIDWDPALHRAARSQHDGIDWDRLSCSAARSQHDGVDWDCARDRRERKP